MKRFWDKVDKSGDCWLWTASCRPNGYGQIGIGSRSDGSRTVVLAHRLAYELQIGVIPDGICVLHRCDNPKCVRGSHLFLGSQADNMADKVAKNRQLRGERHPMSTFTEGDVKTFRDVVSVGCKQSLLADFLGLTRQSLNDIITGKIWADV